MSILAHHSLSTLVLKKALDSFSFESRRYLDWTLVILLAMVISVGLVFETSSSVAIAESRTGEPLYYLHKHLVFLGLGLFCAAFTFLIPMKVWLSYSHWLLVLGFALLILVLIPGIGIRANGSQRWLNFGLLSFQVSEFAKMAMLMFTASYLVRQGADLRASWGGFSKPMVILAGMLLLLLMEPDFGSSVVLSGTVLGMLFLAGIPLLRFLLTMTAATVVLAYLATSSSYRMDRILAFMDPWADQFNTGYQLTQALIAFGRGEWFGVGLGNSLQKLFYLPEAHTDFVFAVIAEETGLVGAFAVIVILWTLGQRILRIGHRCLAMSAHKQSNKKESNKKTVDKNKHLEYAGYLVSGIGLMFLIQCFINIGVACGLLPTKGLTLPFISYGGSSLLVWCVLMALVLKADWELEKTGYVGQRVSA